MTMRRWWLLRRHKLLQRKIAYLDAKLALYKHFPHHLGFDDLERMAKEKRRLKKLRFDIGVLELQLRFVVGRAPPARTVSS